MCRCADRSGQESNGSFLSARSGGDRLRLSEEVGSAPEDSGEAEVQRRDHRHGGGIQPIPDPHPGGRDAVQPAD